MSTTSPNTRSVNLARISSTSSKSNNVDAQQTLNENTTRGDVVPAHVPTNTTEVDEDTEIESIWESETDDLLESETISSEKFQTEEVSDSDPGHHFTSAPTPTYTFTTGSFTGPEDIDKTSSALDSSNTTPSPVHSSDELADRSPSPMDMTTTYSDDTPDLEEEDSTFHSEMERKNSASMDSSEGLSEFKPDILSESDVNDSSSMMDDLDNPDRSDFPEGSTSTRDSHGASDSKDVCSESPDSRDSECSEKSDSSSSTSSRTSDEPLDDTVHIYNMGGVGIYEVPAHLIREDGSLPRPGEVNYAYHDERGKANNPFQILYSKDLNLPEPSIKLGDYQGTKFQLVSAFKDPDSSNFISVGDSYLPRRFVHRNDSNLTCGNESEFSVARAVRL